VSKNRIKEEIDGNGESVFYPQYRFLGFWKTYEYMVGMSGYMEYYRYNTKEEANDFINDEKNRSRRNTVKKEIYHEIW